MTVTSFSREGVSMELAEAGPSRSHDLARVNLWSILEQRFYGDALDCRVTCGTSGWTDLPMAEVESMFDMLLANWTVSRARGGTRFRAFLATTATGPAPVHVWFAVDGGEWQACAASDDEATVARVLARLEAAFPSPTATDDAVPVRFWTLGPYGPEPYSRRLDAAPWSAVAGNYPSKLSARLGALMEMPAPATGGRLILWHGPPGTGKTHCIRALAAAWQPWCDVDYVVDADEFFDHAHYMVGTMVRGEDPYGDRWRLLVIEDAGEWLLDGARGQGLSRLLNLTDGLVGQGLRLLVLMTTNEPVQDLHAAVTRPGRCLANLRFDRFSIEEAGDWLAARECAVDVDGELTLAELYALGS